MVSCYQDNVVPAKNSELAVLDDSGKVYTDDSGNTYLNPNSDLAYRYIKDIIEEANTQGVKVFILNETKLPSDISEKYEDGFDVLSAKLYKDIGSDIKLLEAVNISLSERQQMKAAMKYQKK